MRWLKPLGSPSRGVIPRGAMVLPIVVAVIFSLSGWAGTTPRPWAEKDWTKWSSWDCEYVFTYSPWVWYDEGRGRETGPTLKYGDYYGTEVVEIRSALPFRQALVRRIQIHKHYDKMNLQQKQAFDREHAAELAEDNNDRVEIMVSNSAGHFSPYYGNYLYSFPARRAALLLSDGTLVIPLQTTVSSPASADYVFPRTVDGRPIYTTSDKYLRIVFGDVTPFDPKHKELGPQRPEELPLDSYRRKYPFEISTLMYKGKLEY